MRLPPVQPRLLESRGLVEIYRDEYISVSAEPTGKLVRLRRTSVQHPTPDDLERSFRLVARAIDHVGRTDRVMLIDMREALGRNEPEFDMVMRRIRVVVEQKMSRIAVLLRSSAGMLQMKRINQEDNVMRLLTMNEQEAIEFLLQ